MSTAPPYIAKFSVKNELLIVKLLHCITPTAPAEKAVQFVKLLSLIVRIFACIEQMAPHTSAELFENTQFSTIKSFIVKIAPPYLIRLLSTYPFAFIKVIFSNVTW